MPYDSLWMLYTVRVVKSKSLHNLEIIGNCLLWHGQTTYVDGTPTSSQSLSGRSAQPTMVTLVNIMVMNGRLTSFSFHVNRSSHSLFQTLETPRSRSWVWSMDKVMSRPSILLILSSYSFHMIRPTIPEIKLFRNLTSNVTSKVKVISEVKGQGHIYPVSKRCISFSFHINRANHSWDMAIIVFDLEQSKSKGFDSCDRPSNLTQIGFKSIFLPMWPWSLMDELRNQ